MDSLDLISFPITRRFQHMTQQTNAFKHSGPLIITGLVLLLLILHQDNWFWTDGTLVFGFVPMALFWHACISLGAVATWFLATRIAWPLSDETDEQEGGE